MESKKIYSSAYAKKLAKGLFAVNIFLPIEKREELEEKARSESLPLTVYLRGLIRKGISPYLPVRMKIQNIDHENVK